ncbi:MAG: hypothetical protein WBM99_08620, partial [Psychromonas sp.]
MMLKQLSLAMLRRPITTLKPLPIFIFGVASLSAGVTSPAFAASNQWVVSWADSSNNEDGFIVERKTDGEYLTLATLGVNTTSYTDVTGIAGQTNCYRVGAFNQAGSAYSAETCIDVPAEVSTVEVPATEESTAEESTAEESTAEKSTAEESTAEESTAEESTAEESTAEESTAEESTTEESTTEKSTIGTNIVQSRVSTSADDAEEDPDGSMSLNSSDLELVEESFTQTVGMRFTSLD